MMKQPQAPDAAGSLPRQISARFVLASTILAMGACLEPAAPAQSSSPAEAQISRAPERVFLRPRGSVSADAQARVREAAASHDLRTLGEYAGACVLAERPAGVSLA